MIALLLPFIFKMEDLRHTIKFYYDKGFGPYAIWKKLEKFKVHQWSVYRIVKRLRDTGSVNDRIRSGRLRSVRTPLAIKRVRERIRRNPQRSVRSLSADLKIARRSLQRMVIIDLGLRPYKKRKVHGLTDAQKKTQLERSKS